MAGSRRVGAESPPGSNAIAGGADTRTRTKKPAARMTNAAGGLYHAPPDSARIFEASA
jgi:hypothetical protein